MMLSHPRRKLKVWMRCIVVEKYQMNKRLAQATYLRGMLTNI